MQTTHTLTEENGHSSCIAIQVLVEFGWETFPSANPEPVPLTLT